MTDLLTHTYGAIAVPVSTDVLTAFNLLQTLGRHRVNFAPVFETEYCAAQASIAFAETKFKEMHGIVYFNILAGHRAKDVFRQELVAATNQGILSGYILDTDLYLPQTNIAGSGQVGYSPRRFDLMACYRT